mmetsp:Transcript_5726/g.18730  ORF Transcript_5726/g.18730 Transcript_5726/m.18730 type:complete len:271 (+) Transcript_5726:289-1101(+)
MPSSRESARRRSRAAWPSSKWRASPAGLPARGGPRAHLRGSALFLAGEHRKLLNRVRVARSPKVLPLPDGDPLREQGHGRRPSHPASARLRGAEGAPRPQSSVTRWTPASLPRISRPRLTPHLSLPKGAWLLGAGPRREAVGRQRAAAAATWLATPASDRLPRRRAPSAVSRRIRCGSSRRSNSRRARPRRPSWAGARPARPEARWVRTSTTAGTSTRCSTSSARWATSASTAPSQPSARAATARPAARWAQTSTTPRILTSWRELRGRR